MINQTFLLNDNNNNNRKGFVILCRWRFKAGFKAKSRNYDKISANVKKKENLTSVNSNILALGTEQEQKPSSQQQNLMKNLMKTRNLNKIETGVGLTMSVVAQGGVERKGL